MTILIRMSNFLEAGHVDYARLKHGGEHLSFDECNCGPAVDYRSIQPWIRELAGLSDAKRLPGRLLHEALDKHGSDVGTYVWEDLPGFVQRALVEAERAMHLWVPSIEASRKPARVIPKDAREDCLDRDTIAHAAYDVFTAWAHMWQFGGRTWADMPHEDKDAWTSAVGELLGIPEEVPGQCRSRTT